MVAFNKNCHILAFSLVFCLFLHDATSITVGQVVIQIKNQNSQNLCGLHSSADFIFFFSQKLRITFECGLNSSAGCFRVNTVSNLKWCSITAVKTARRKLNNFVLVKTEEHVLNPRMEGLFAVVHLV